jgi:hypothetical protein
VAITRVAFAKAVGVSGSAVSTASFTWSAGDLFIAIQGNESGDVASGTPTFGGGTFTSAVAATGADNTHCYGRAWSCAVAGSGSGTVTDPSVVRARNIYVWQFSGALSTVGTGSGGLADTTFVRSTVNQGGGSGSWVVMGMFDWTATAASNTLTGSPPVTNEVDDTKNGTLYDGWGGDWSGQSGTVSYGITAGSGTWTKIVVEVRDAGGAPAALPPFRQKVSPAAIRRSAFY